MTTYRILDSEGTVHVIQSKELYFRVDRQGNLIFFDENPLGRLDDLQFAKGEWKAIEVGDD